MNEVEAQQVGSGQRHIKGGATKTHALPPENKICTRYNKKYLLHLRKCSKRKTQRQYHCMWVSGVNPLCMDGWVDTIVHCYVIWDVCFSVISFEQSEYFFIIIVYFITPHSIISPIDIGFYI